MRGTNIYVLFSPKKTFHELQFHQTLIFSLDFSTCPDNSILDKSVSAILQKVFGFNFICVLEFFQKYSMSSVQKNPKIYFNIHYFANRGHTSLPY